MATYAIVVVPAAHRDVLDVLVRAAWGDGFDAQWCSEDAPAGPATHWIIGDTMDEERLAFYQFPTDHPFMPPGGWPLSGYTEEACDAARLAAQVYTVTAEVLGADDYQQCRDLVTGMMGIVPWQPD